MKSLETDRPLVIDVSGKSLEDQDSMTLIQHYLTHESVHPFVTPAILCHLGLLRHASTLIPEVKLDQLFPDLTPEEVTKFQGKDRVRFPVHLLGRSWVCLGAV